MGMFKIEKLNDSNFHYWKQQVEYALALKELSDYIIPTSDRPSPSDVSKAKRDDAKAKAVIGMTLGKDHAELVKECKTAHESWTTILELFQRKTLLNKLMTRRRFYAAKMESTEKAMAFISRVRQLSYDCKALDISIDDKDVAMTVLCGLPQKYEHLIVAIDAVATDTTLTLDFVKSRLLQEEQRMQERNEVQSPKDAALVGSQNNSSSGRKVPECDHCGRRGHTEQTCWDKYPHLRPKQRKKGKAAGLAAKEEPIPETSDSEPEVSICLMASVKRPEVEHATKAKWIIDNLLWAGVPGNSSSIHHGNVPGHGDPVTFVASPVCINIHDRSHLGIGATKHQSQVLCVDEVPQHAFHTVPMQFRRTADKLSKSANTERKVRARAHHEVHQRSNGRLVRLRCRRTFCSQVQRRIHWSRNAPSGRHPETVNDFLRITSLRQTQRSCVQVTGNIHSEDDPGLTQVLHLETRTQLAFRLSEDAHVIARNEQVIDVQRDDQDVPPLTAHVNTLVSIITFHAKCVHKEVVHSGIPLTWRLLQPIDRLQQEVHELLRITLLEPFQLLHVHQLL